MEWFGNGASFIDFHDKKDFAKLNRDWLLE